MFNFKKSKEKFVVLSPITGECLPITEVGDAVFSQKMMGDGFAVKPAAGTHQVLAPISGEVVALPESKHAVGLKSTLYDVEVLVHIGFDTVKLQGKGFKALVKQGQLVKAGDVLIEFNENLMKKEALDTTTLVIFTSGYNEPINLTTKNHQKVSAGTLILQEA